MSKQDQLKALGKAKRNLSQSISESPHIDKPKRGRPRIGEPKQPKAEPWKALGMSERTWYRRKKEKK
jgi:uncharacterized protein (DUF2384 family)